MAPAMQVIRPGFFLVCRKGAGLNARWTRALVRRLSIPVKSGFGYARFKSRIAYPELSGVSTIFLLSD